MLKQFLYYFYIQCFFPKLVNSTLGTLMAKPVYCSTCFVSVSSSSGSFLPNNLKTLTVKINMLLRKKMLSITTTILAELCQLYGLKCSRSPKTGIPNISSLKISSCCLLGTNLSSLNNLFLYSEVPLLQ